MFWFNLVTLVQIEEVITATKAAQALVEEAHQEIELSGIQPVLRLASLDAKIPLSMLRLPTKPGLPTPMQPNGAAHGHLAAGTDGLSAPSSTAVTLRAQQRVSHWDAEQLAQIMSDVESQKELLSAAMTTEASAPYEGTQPAQVGTVSTEAVAGSPAGDSNMSGHPSPDSLLVGQVSQSGGSPCVQSGQPTSRRSYDRMLSPFALTPAPSRS